MNFFDAKTLLELCEGGGINISEAMLRREQAVLGRSREETTEAMRHSYSIMKSAVARALTENLNSMGGLIGGEARQLAARAAQTGPVCGMLMSRAVTYAVGTLEVNASMGLIVAAPTGGSCGVLPGAMIALQEEFSLTDEQVISALFNASAIGYLFMRNATVAGAEGGCQAEVGAASAMAASAVCELMGGTPGQCMAAASSAISNTLGLVCDPIAGLVECPCQKRNAMGVSNALVCAEMALAGVREHIPLDEAIATMYAVGRSIPYELRETALGGIAATPTGSRLCARIFGGK